MIVRIVKLTFQENHIADFQSIFESYKEKIRAFPGNQHLELLQDKNDPRVFFTYSIWDKDESLQAYRHSELFTSTWAMTKVLFAEKPVAWSTAQLHRLA